MKSEKKKKKKKKLKVLWREYFSIKWVGTGVHTMMIETKMSFVCFC